VSIHPLEICEQYAQYLHDTHQGITNPGGWARCIYDGKYAGQYDAKITAWLERQARQKAEAEQRAREAEAQRQAEIEALADHILAHGEPLQDWERDFLISIGRLPLPAVPPASEEQTNDQPPTNPPTGKGEP
jgi:hypothetical protein